MKGSRRLRFAVAVSLLALVGVAWWARANAFTAAYIVDTRRFMVALKTGGHIPDVGWLSLARRMGPKWMQRNEPAFVTAGPAGAEPCPVQWQTPLGPFWGGKDDGEALDHLVMEALGGRIYDRAPADIRPGDVVIDTGAHLGTFTRYALRRGASKVIAVEPMPDLVACLERTFRDEIAAGRVTIAQVAAWNENTELQLARVDFVKMDIEGAEPQALRGAVGLLASHDPRMAICIYHGDDDADAVRATVMGAAPRYREFRRGPFQAYFHR